MCEKLPLVLSGVILMLVLSGCAPKIASLRDPSQSATNTKGAAIETTEVKIKNGQFTPDNISINKGDAVTFINLDVDLARLDQIADGLSQLPEVRAIYYTSGESDLILEAWFPSGDELLHFLTRQVASIPGVRSATTSHVLRTLKDSSTWVLPSPTPSRILLVDDDPDFVAITQMTLTSAGFEVLSASCGSEALALMRVNKPDLVILDVMMSGVLDGIQTAREIRSDSRTQNVPILMVSSITNSAFAGLLPKEETLPADNFLVKPIDSSLLVAEAKRLIRLKAT